ncbi:MAG: GNAT family N-acetyltransferase [Lachnospiraceae bacterium]|nr:GNAT family N-acetyltransferase [Lachnospiraceae bacterium]
MEFRKATHSDFSTIVEIYQSGILHLDSIGIHQWDESYPSATIIEADIQNKEMYVGLIDDKIVTAFTINPKYDEEYSKGNWQYSNLPFLVLHRFCVNPQHQNKGVGTQTMTFIENTLKSENFQCLRLDAFSLNHFSLRLYEKFGFTKVGEVTFSKGLFYLFEKKL